MGTQPESRRIPSAMLGLCWPGIAAWGGFAVSLAADHALDGESLNAPLTHIALALALLGLFGAIRAWTSRTTRVDRSIAIVCNMSFPAAFGMVVMWSMGMSGF